jgi:predicted DNA-binding transcriptional regulator AlpA
MNTKTPETSVALEANTMSPVPAPNTGELARMLMGALNTAQENSVPGASSATRDSRGLEMLVRLIVRDELQRHVSMPSNDPRNADDSEDVPGYAPVGAAETASDGDPDAEVMSARDVAAFLGLDRNTVYDYAGRGTIPCRRLGKRLLFHRPTLVSWLDPCKAASTRKA